MSEIIEEYANSLKELTFNSRPIIDNLTTIASENTEVADGIIDAIVNRTYKCLPEQKLFALYLLDSICKTVGNPYNILVGDEIFKLFSHVYLLVNDTVRQKLVNLFETWKLTKTKGTNSPLFPQQETDKIQTFLNKANPAATASGGGNLTNSALIKDIDELAPFFVQRINSNPGDSKLKDRFNALTQLKFLLQNQKMQPNELLAVQNQLNSIKQQEAQARPANSAASSTPTLNTVVTHSAGPSPGSKPGSRAGEIFDQLVNLGLVTFEQELRGPRVYEINYPKSIDNNESVADNLLEQILNHQMMRSEYQKQRHTELSKLKQKGDNIQQFIGTGKISMQCKNLLYDAKGLKCAICGKRFSQDEEGANKKRLHLDWHFRVNKKSKASNTVQSRNWYLDDYDWVKFDDANLLEFAVEENTQNAQQAANVKTEVPYVVIPSSETNMINKCLICREQVKGTFSDELGEWYWYNCIVLPGEPKTSRKIVHASCFSEANKKRGADSELNRSVKREKY